MSSLLAKFSTGEIGNSLRNMRNQKVFSECGELDDALHILFH
jgi:hypothetical protein